MIGSLYIIHNSINDKVYIGKTYDSIQNRFKEHLRDVDRFPTRPLYKAILKHGWQNFKVEELGKFEEGILEQEESDYIQEFNSYKNGYNATLGGDGHRYVDIEDTVIIQNYKETKSINDTSRFLKIDKGTVTTVLKAYNIEIDQYGKHRATMKPVLLVDKDLKFNCILDCAKYLVDNGISKVTIKATASSISRVLVGSRESYLKLKFKYI